MTCRCLPPQRRSQEKKLSTLEVTFEIPFSSLEMVNLRRRQIARFMLIFFSLLLFIALLDFQRDLSPKAMCHFFPFAKCMLAEYDEKNPLISNCFSG